MIKTWKKFIELGDKVYKIIYTESDYYGGSKMITSKMVLANEKEISRFIRKTRNNIEK
jgi:hypothetical protein